MGSPSFPFKFLTDSEFSAVRSEAVAAAQGKKFDSLGGGAKSGTFYRMPLDQFLIEVNAESRRRGGLPTVQKVVQNLTGIPADTL